MTDRRKTWLSVGVVALASTSLSPLPAAAEATDGQIGVTSAKQSSFADIAGDAGDDTSRAGRRGGEGGGEGGEGGGEAGGEGGGGGEGGEGGEGGAAPESYTLLSTDPNAYKYDAKAEIANYAAGVHASYEAAYHEAEKLEDAVEALLANPNDATLAAARKAWVAARPAYLVTETFRFYDGPIEALEGQINAWPMNEAFIDYVEGKPDAGIINDKRVEVAIAEIIKNNQVSDEADVTTGWHAVEFLLWGQDLDTGGPGNRPASDFIAGQGNNDRRRTYLHLVTEQLVHDIHEVAEAWEPGEANYAKQFLALPEREAVGRMVNGMAVLAGFEFMSERLAVALDSGDQEDEHSCFSDTTHQDFVNDLKGIGNVWNGTYPGVTRAGGKGLGREGRSGACHGGGRPPRGRDGKGGGNWRPLRQGACLAGGKSRAPGRGSCGHRAPGARRRLEAGRQQARRAGADSLRLRALL